MRITDEQQKAFAVETHSEQARLFAERYSEIAGDPYGNCFRYSRHRLNTWLDKLLPNDGRGLRLLDLGCGTGYHLAMYRHRGFAVVGVDGSEDMLVEAGKANPEIDFYRCDVESVPLESDSFDIVMSIEVIRYLPETKAYINEVFRLLANGGTALVSAAPPLQANLYPLVNRFSRGRQIGSLTNLRQFFHGVGRLRSDFEAAGFSEIKMYGVYGGPFVWIERMFPSIIRPTLKTWETVDRITANAPILKHFSNMLLVEAKK